VPKKTTESPFQALEEEAYHAFREWPVWLVLRERELDAHLAAHRPKDAQSAGQASQQRPFDPKLDTRGK
jgi:hypothetical protein